MYKSIFILSTRTQTKYVLYVLKCTKSEWNSLQLINKYKWMPTSFFQHYANIFNRYFKYEMIQFIFNSFYHHICLRNSEQWKEHNVCSLQYHLFVRSWSICGCFSTCTYAIIISSSIHFLSKKHHINIFFFHVID